MQHIKKIIFAVILITTSFNIAYSQSDLQLSHNLFLYLDKGKLYVWGNNENQIFKEWPAPLYSQPQLGSKDSNWLQIDGSSLGFVGLKNDGSIWGIGRNENGQFGENTSDTIRYWKQISSSKNWVSVGISERAVYAINNKNELWAAGTGIGDGTTTTKTEWEQLVPNIEWNKMYVDEGTSFFISKSKALFGYGRYKGNERSSLSLFIDSVKIGNIADKIVEIKSSINNSCILWNNGIVSMLGNNLYGQRGAGYFGGPEVDILNYQSNGGYLFDFSSIAIDNGTFLGVKFNGEVWGCGQNTCGNLGDGTDSNRNKAVYLKQLSQAKKVFTFAPNSVHVGPTNSSCNNWNTFIGSSHTSFILDNSLNLYSFGHNSMNECGDGAKFYNNNFIKLPLGKIKKIKTFNGSSFALDSNNQLWFTGEKQNNQIGALGVPNNPYYVYHGFPYREYQWKKCPEGDSVVNFDLTTQGVIVLKSNGWLWSWGRANFNDRLGFGTVPMKITTSNSWKQLGFNGNCQDNFLVLLNTKNNIEILGNAPLFPNPKDFITLNKFDKFSVGYNSVYSIRNDSVWVWGKSYSNLGVGNFGDPLNPKLLNGQWRNIYTNSTPTSSTQSFGINTKGQLYAWGNSKKGNIGTYDSIDGIIYSPKLIDSTKNWIQISSNKNSTFGLTADGEIYYWGQDNLFLRKDISIPKSEIIRPKLLNNSNKWKLISSDGGNVVYAIDEKGDLYGMGTSQLGQMGNDTKDHLIEPKIILKGNSGTQVKIDAFETFSMCKDFVLAKTDRIGVSKLIYNQSCRFRCIDIYDLFYSHIGHYEINQNNEITLDLDLLSKGIYLVCGTSDNNSLITCKKCHVF
jgi:alpha-tubulin suppressor-like RCC1 family protein